MAEAEETNFYHPEDDEAGAGYAHASKKPATISWTASEFIDHQRGPGWYFALTAVTAALAAGAYFAFHDRFASVIIVVLGIILAFYADHKPRQVTYELNSRGLKIGERPYRYSEFKAFALSHEGPLSTITFYPLKRLALPLSIFFESKNANRIINLIGEHLPLDERGPDSFEKLTRRLKI